jgi:HEAT repeat protein
LKGILKGLIKWLKGSRSGARTSLDCLFQELKNIEDAYGRVKIISAIGALRKERALKPLIRFFEKEKNPRVRRWIAFVLGGSGNRKVVGPLLKILGSEKSPQVLSWTILALGRLGDKRAVEPLIEILKSNEDDKVRKEAVSILGILKDPRAIRYLQMTLFEKTYIWPRAIIALQRIREGQFLPLLFFLDRLIIILFNQDRT